MKNESLEYPNIAVAFHKVNEFTSVHCQFDQTMTIAQV